MDGQALDLTKPRKENVKPSPQRSGKSLGSSRRKLDQDTWGFPGARDPRDVQQGQIKTKTIQGGMPRNPKNKDRCVLISHPMMQKMGQKI